MPFIVPHQAYLSSIPCRRMLLGRSLHVIPIFIHLCHYSVQAKLKKDLAASLEVQSELRSCIMLSSLPIRHIEVVGPINLLITSRIGPVVISGAYLVWPYLSTAIPQHDPMIHQ